MSWSEIKKVVNSDFTTPLNTRIDSQTSTLSNKIDSQTSTLSNKIDSQTTTLANKFGFKFESVTSYDSSGATSWTPSKDGIIVATTNDSSGSFIVGLSTKPSLGTSVIPTQYIIELAHSKSNYLQGQAIALVKANKTLYVNGKGTITYYSLGRGIS